MQDKEYLLSVVIPVYKVERYLERCVDSVLAAAIENMQIVLVDDGSPDSCPAICDSYAAAHDNIYVIHQENMGISATRNRGIQAARGEYIFFLDSDDAVAPELFREFLANISARSDRPDLLLIDCVFVHDETNEETPFVFPATFDQLHNVTGQQALKAMLSNRPYFEWYCWRYFYRRAYLLENGIDFPVGVIFEDVLFVSKAVILAKLVDYMPIAGLRYTCFRKGSYLNSLTAEKVAYKVFISDQSCKFDLEHVEDPELLSMLLSNHAEYYLGAFRNYCEAVPGAYPYVKKYAWLAKYSSTKFGKVLYRATSVLGFRLGSLAAKLAFRVRGLGK